MREVLGGTLPGCRARSGHLSPALAHRLGCRSLPARAARDGLGCGESLLGARQGAARVRGREGVPGPRRSHAGPCAHVSGRADGRPGDGGYVGLLSRKEAAAAAGVRGASLGARGRLTPAGCCGRSIPCTAPGSSTRTSRTRTRIPAPARKIHCAGPRPPAPHRTSGRQAGRHVTGHGHGRWAVDARQRGAWISRSEPGRGLDLRGARHH